LTVLPCERAAAFGRRRNRFAGDRGSRVLYPRSCTRARATQFGTMIRHVGIVGSSPLAPTISNRCRELCRHGRTPGGWTVLWVQVRLETPRIVTIARTDRGCTSGRLFAADQRWIDGRHRANARGAPYSAPGAGAASNLGRPMCADGRRSVGATPLERLPGQPALGSLRAPAVT